MSNARTAQQFAARIEAIGHAAQQAQREAVGSASLILKRSIELQLTAAVGPDHRMRNLRKYKESTPPKLSVGYDVKGTNNPTALLKARGPWGLVEYNVGAHRITPRLDKSGTGKGVSRADRMRSIRQRELDQAFGARGVYAGKRPMPIGGVYRYSAMHPGTTGKAPFRLGLEAATPRAVQELNTVVLRGVVNTFRSGRQSWDSFRASE